MNDLGMRGLISSKTHTGLVQRNGQRRIMFHAYEKGFCRGFDRRYSERKDRVEDCSPHANMNKEGISDAERSRRGMELSSFSVLSEEDAGEPQD